MRELLDIQGNINEMIEKLQIQMPMGLEIGESLITEACGSSIPKEFLLQECLNLYQENGLDSKQAVMLRQLFKVEKKDGILIEEIKIKTETE